MDRSDGASGVAADHVEKLLIGRPVKEILAGVQFEADIDPAFFVRIENWPPAMPSGLQTPRARDRPDAAARDRDKATRARRRRSHAQRAMLAPG